MKPYGLRSHVTGMGEVEWVVVTSLRGCKFTQRECRGPVKSMVSVVRGFEVRRGRSGPIETEVEEERGSLDSQDGNKH